MRVSEPLGKWAIVAHEAGGQFGGGFADALVCWLLGRAAADFAAYVELPAADTLRSEFTEVLLRGRRQVLLGAVLGSGRLHGAVCLEFDHLTKVWAVSAHT